MQLHPFVHMYARGVPSAELDDNLTSHLHSTAQMIPTTPLFNRAVQRPTTACHSKAGYGGHTMRTAVTLVALCITSGRM